MARNRYQRPAPQPIMQDLPDPPLPCVFVVDDDAGFRRNVGRVAAGAGCRVEEFGDAPAALEALDRLGPALVLTDLRLPGVDGLELLAALRERRPELPVVLMTGHGDIATAVQAMRAGAYDFLEKPFGRERLVSVIERAQDRRRLLEENFQLKHRLASAAGMHRVLRGESAAMRELRDLVLRLAATSVDVLLRGETGTGKELVARCLHDHGSRGGRFVAVNCAAVPEALFEGELFGHERGGPGGCIGDAAGGTLFLDEIEAMPLALQARLLHVLQEREQGRPGGPGLRVVAATQSDLGELARRGGFRADLFYRLNVASLAIAPLRERLGDVPMLFEEFAAQASLRHQVPLPRLGARQQQALLAASWPGNVRELKACAERFVLGLPLFIDGRLSGPGPRTFDESIAMVERSLLETALRRHGGSVRAACAELSLTQATIYRKLKTLGIDPAQYKSAGSQRTDERSFEPPAGLRGTT